MTDREASKIEHICGVTIDTYDNSGSTTVYGYTDDGDCLAFSFESMNPDTGTVLRVALAIGTLLGIANMRPRVGRMSQ